MSSLITLQEIFLNMYITDALGRNVLKASMFNFLNFLNENVDKSGTNIFWGTFIKEFLNEMMVVMEKFVAINPDFKTNKSSDIKAFFACCVWHVYVLYTTDEPMLKEKFAKMCNGFGEIYDRATFVVKYAHFLQCTLFNPKW
jgi:hypothetical protein